MALFLPFAVMLIIAVPVYYYRRTKRDGNKDDERKAEAWTNVFTQISFVWMFATIVTVCLKIVDCDQGTEGRLIMDPSLPCPLAATGTPDAGPAVLGLSMLVIYSFGILLFLRAAIRIALSAVRERVKKFAGIKILEYREANRKERKKQREQNPNEQEARKDLQEETKDQQEIDEIENESEAKNDENEEWKLVGWLMEDYKYPVFELWNGAFDGAICCC